MFVGELEFSDIPIDLDSDLMPLSYLYFLSFVILIVVVLMNLLNGLAVSDTNDIKEKAEIYSYISRVETISYMESVLLGDPFDFLSNVPVYLASLPSGSLLRQMYRNACCRKVETYSTSYVDLTHCNFIDRHLGDLQAGRKEFPPLLQLLAQQTSESQCF